ncbi:putative nucleotidyltransferase substrate binding domain-containing protein [Cocleimonas flava]|uniref:CBS domain-containing protein n=1 Tax=Cocleimonas flava TaxID=634765 RepID=A0A4R1FE99_9GAMM|nr:MULTISPECIES: DUF294 nucleotidyltransferase-like domain-containing protein [Cocleimonas]MEB8431511.1 DUF294 nucleotidyltransferase-like domain-containing protein [Cocleimonas sp. KMM 6892]MEC4713717.1 DUF294 nucleotidyltransferase-like domain-containing protein [Cocleimonas sp. KMM 6895]MEC4743048.1 DUF294 nucleotidyltransferase-like domain-containing protein [Cocleimonas sp. KMM 6896]TCJ89191.1 CBS domain-containing protein [Cocleimonas flava]
MEIEQLEIREYLETCSPLDKLSAKTLDEIVKTLEVTYLRRGKPLLTPGDENQSLYLIRTGALELYDTEGNIAAQLSEGDWAGHRSTMLSGIVTRKVMAIEDSLLYIIAAPVFKKLLKEEEGIREYFSERKHERLRSAIKTISNNERSSLISTRVSELSHATPLIVESNTTIREAANRMTNEHVSALLVINSGETNIQGIITDREFCTKVVAKGLNLEDSVDTIMTRNLITMPSTATASQALLTMARNNIRHIPVLENNIIKSMVTAADIIRQQSNNAVYLINEIHRAKSVEELTSLSKQLAPTLVNLVNSGLNADDTAHSISSIGESIAKRLLRMAEDKLGPPPVPYAFIIAGSQARNEQTAHSDQDNALILSDDYVEEKHDEYFLALAKFVSDGLDACGYIYCPGDVMATNKKWRQPFSTWLAYFKKWIDEPEPKPLMYASIFFDLRCIHGEQQLLEALQTKVYKRTKKSDLFINLMVDNALHYRPPLGLFRHFVLEKTGAEQKALNMKKRGVVPIIDLARVYALKAGSHVINTQERLDEAAIAGVLSQEGRADLKDAFEFISTVRLKHQAMQIENGKIADNHVPPEELSSLERRHLKDSFEIVSTLQTAMERLS